MKVSVLDTDRYERSVGVVTTDDGGILNRELLTNGYAWLYTRYCKAYFCSEWQAQEMRARKSKSGLWSYKAAVEPRNWRKAKRSR